MGSSRTGGLLSVPSDDGLEAAPAQAVLARVFGDALPQVVQFHDLLAEYGVERGLIGPREVPRLWERHLVNSAALVPFLPASGAIADVGSGAGLPGLVVAAMRPEVDLHLVEPMRRRVAWLREVVGEIGLDRVTVHEARAEDVAGIVRVDVVTARAVASLDRLVPWTLPLLRGGGRLVLLKGRHASDELDAAAVALRASGAASWRLHEVDPGDLGSRTTVVEIFTTDGSHAGATGTPSADELSASGREGKGRTGRRTTTAQSGRGSRRRRGGRRPS